MYPSIYRYFDSLWNRFDYVTMVQSFLDFFNDGSTLLLRYFPFVAKSLGMQIMISVLMFFLYKNIMSYKVLFRPPYANGNVVYTLPYNDPQSDVFITCFTCNAYICAIVFYIQCNILSSGMKNVAVRNALILLSLSVSAIQIILYFHIFYKYIDIYTHTITFDSYNPTHIFTFNFLFSVLVFMTGMYMLSESNETYVKEETNNYFDLCFQLMVVHLCFVFFLYFQYKFRSSKFFKSDVINLKIIQYVSYFMPFVFLFLGEYYVFVEKPFAFGLKIFSVCVFLIVFYYVTLLIRLNSGISYFAMYFSLLELKDYAEKIGIQILLSVLLLVITLDITFS